MKALMTSLLMKKEAQSIGMKLINTSNMKTTTNATNQLTHIDAVRASYSQNTASCKLILGMNDETYFDMVSDIGFKFLKKHKLFDQLKANPLFWNWIRLIISKSERLFL